MGQNLKKKVRDYVKKVGGTTIGNVKEYFSITEDEAKEVIFALVEQGALEHTVGFVFQCANTFEEPLIEEEEEDDDVERQLEEQRALLKKRKKEILARIQATMQQNGADDEETTLEEVLDAFGDGVPFEQVGETEFLFKPDLKYPDETELQFKLKGDKAIILTDDGATMKYVLRKYQNDEAYVKEELDKNLSRYGVSRADNDLFVVIVDPCTAFERLMKLYAAIQYAVFARFDQQLDVVIEEIENKTEAKMREIIFDKGLNLIEARNYALEELITARKAKDEGSVIIFERVSKTFSKVEEEEFDLFKRWLEGSI